MAKMMAWNSVLPFSRVEVWEAEIFIGREVGLTRQAASAIAELHGEVAVDAHPLGHPVGTKSPHTVQCRDYCRIRPSEREYRADFGRVRTAYTYTDYSRHRVI